MKTKISLGCDPEIFCTNAEGNFKSAIDTFGGSKNMPLMLPIGDGYAVQEDNVALEFNIPPADSGDVFVNSINTVINYLSDVAAQHFGLQFSKESGVLFPLDQLQDIRALEFGCDPDFNAWTGKKNPRPSAVDPTLRSAGGHVHVGLDNSSGLTRGDKCRLIRLMDLHLGIPSVVMDNGDLRKELYGKAGAMRFKNYGVEYRTLSNFWVFSGVMNRWVWDATERAVEDFECGRDVADREELITGIINNNNKKAASAMIAEHHLLYV